MGRATAPSREYRIGPAASIPERGGVLAVADGTEVGVFRVNGELCRFTDPHGSAWEAPRGRQ